TSIAPTIPWNICGPPREPSAGGVDRSEPLNGPRASELFGDGFRLQELKQVVRTSGLRVGAGHVESAKRMGSDHRAGALPIDVEISHEELVARAPDFLRIL